MVKLPWSRFIGVRSLTNYRWRNLFSWWLPLKMSECLIDKFRVPGKIIVVTTLSDHSSASNNHLRLQLIRESLTLPRWTFSGRELWQHNLKMFCGISLTSQFANGAQFLRALLLRSISFDIFKKARQLSYYSARVYYYARRKDNLSCRFWLLLILDWNRWTVLSLFLLSCASH